MEYQSLSHTKWECKYHVVFIPKCRRKHCMESCVAIWATYFTSWPGRRNAGWRKGLMLDHVHMLLSIPPKHSVAQVLGFLKGKSAIHIARAFGGRKRNFVGQHFWARGYLVSTVGKDETVIRRYIQEQEQQDKRSDQQEKFGGEARL